MNFLFLAPLPSAFGEAIHGARLASALADRGHVAHFAAPSVIAPVLADPRVPLVPIDSALGALDDELPLLVARLDCDVLVLVDAAAVDKVARAFDLSIERIAAAAPRSLSLDCWNLVEPPDAWDYGAVTEPLDPWLLEQSPVIRPVPIAPLDTPGGYAALPALAPASPAERAAIRERLKVPRDAALIAWPTARWQLPGNHDNPALGRIAARLEQVLAPVFSALGDDVAVAHISPAPIDALRSPSYRHVGQLPALEFESLVAASDALLSFNAAATSLATALSLRIPTALCTARDPAGEAPPLWAWPLSLDAVLAPTVEGNPFYRTMSRLDPLRRDELVDGLRALLFDPAVVAGHTAAQVAYHESVIRLPAGVDQLLAQLG